MGWFPSDAQAGLQHGTNPIQWTISHRFGPQIACQVKNILDASYVLDGYRGLSKKAAILAMRLQLFVYELEDCKEEHSQQCSSTLKGLSLALCDVQNALDCLRTCSSSGPDTDNLLATGIQAACGIFTAASRVGQYVENLETTGGLQAEVEGLKRTMQGYQSELAPHCHDLLHICSFVANEPCSPPELSLLADRVEDALHSVLTDIPLDKQALTEELKVLPMKRDKPLVTLQPGSLPHLRPLLPSNITPNSSVNIISESMLDSLMNDPSTPSAQSTETPVQFSETCQSLSQPTSGAHTSTSHTSVDHAAAESHFSETLAAWRKRQSGESTPSAQPSTPQHAQHDPSHQTSSSAQASNTHSSAAAPAQDQQTGQESDIHLHDPQPPKPCLNPNTDVHSTAACASKPPLVQPKLSQPKKLVARSIFRWGEARTDKPAPVTAAQPHSQTGHNPAADILQHSSSCDASNPASLAQAVTQTHTLVPVSSVEEIAVITPPDGGSSVFATAVTCAAPVDSTPASYLAPLAEHPEPMGVSEGLPHAAPYLPSRLNPSTVSSLAGSTAAAFPTAGVAPTPRSIMDDLNYLSPFSSVAVNSAAVSSVAGVAPTPHTLDDLNFLSPFSAFANQVPQNKVVAPATGSHPPVANIPPALLACFNDLPRSMAGPPHASHFPYPPAQFPHAILPNHNPLPVPLPNLNIPPAAPAPNLLDALKPLLRSTNACPDSLLLPILSPRPPAVRTSPREPAHPTVDPPHYLAGVPCCPPACHAPPRSPGCLKVGTLQDPDAGVGPAPLPLPDQTVHLRTVGDTGPTDLIPLKPSSVQQIDMEKDISNWGPCLGRGGYGRVYKAMYRERPVAVKLLRAAPGDEEDLQALEAEIMHLSQLQHPNIVQVFACSVTPPDLCIVQELMEFDLYDYIHRQCQGMVSLQNCLHIGHQIAQGLREMHPSVVHRDLKPANVLLDRRLHVKIADFGLARSKKSQYLSTQRHDVGTVKYMAPECFQNANVNEKADIYSFGVLMFECLTGKEPWEGLHPLCAMFQVDRGQKLELPHDCIQCPPRLRRLVDSCWASNHKDRPTADVLVRELGQMLEACRAGMIDSLME